MYLDELDRSAWVQLGSAATDKRSGLRYVSLCSVDTAGHPQARLVVLRRVETAARTIEFHTDTRSPKWREFAAYPFATVLGFSAEVQLQLRLQGRVRLHGPGSMLATKAWQNLPHWTRVTYRGGPPGEETDCETPEELSTCALGDDGEGQSVFGLLVFKAYHLDCFQLGRPANKRSLFAYDEAGTLVSGRWVNP